MVLYTLDEKDAAAVGRYEADIALAQHRLQEALQFIAVREGLAAARFDSAQRAFVACEETPT